MATLQKIRNRAGVLVALVIGFSLLAFILGDFFNSGRAFFGRSQFEIAEVAGKSLSYQAYQSKLNEVIEINEIISGRSALDEATSMRIREQTWEQMIRELILEDEYKELGVAVHPDEVFDMVQGNNIHPVIQQLFTDPNTGELNRAAVLQFLKNLDYDPTGQQKAYWLYLEKSMQDERMYAKYMNLISKGLYVPNALAKEEYNNNAKRVNFRFIAKNYATIADSLVTISEEEVKKYYREHQNLFKQEESRDIAYVSFDVKPSQADRSNAEFWINDVKSEFAEVADMVNFVNMNGDASFIDRNYADGELPVEINDFMFSANIGDMYGPYLDGESYKLARLFKINYLPDSVNVRHILIQPTRELDYQAAKEKADSLVALIEKGASFSNLAMLHSDDQGSARNGGEVGWFREGQMVDEFNDASFNGRVGEIQLVETNYGFHIIEVMERGREVKKVQVAILQHDIVASSETYQEIYQNADAFAGMNNTAEKFNAAAQEQALPRRVANYIRPEDQRISGLESPRELVKWAYSAEINEVSPLFEFGDKFIVATLTNVREKGVQPLNEVANLIRVQLRKEKKAAIIAEQAGTFASVDELASKWNTAPNTATNISFASFSVPGAGIEPNLIATAVTTPEGETSGIIEGNNAAFVITVEEVMVEEVNNYDPEKMRMITSLQSRANMEAYEALRENANVKDERIKFF